MMELKLKKYKILENKNLKSVSKFSVKRSEISEQRFRNKLMYAFLQIYLSFILHKLVRTSIPSLRARSFP